MNSQQPFSSADESWQAQLTAFALGQLSRVESDQVAQQISGDERAARYVAEIRRLNDALREPLGEPASGDLRAAVERKLDAVAPVNGSNGEPPEKSPVASPGQTTDVAPANERPSRTVRWRRVVVGLAAIAAGVAAVVFVVPTVRNNYEHASLVSSRNENMDGTVAHPPWTVVEKAREVLERARRGAGHAFVSTGESHQRYGDLPVDELHTLGGGSLPGQFGERYELPRDNPLMAVDWNNARSTFSIDVDTASYANVRRFLTQNMLPPVDAVRVEEMLNYFKYAYPSPRGDHPFAVHLEVATCPWSPQRRLVRIGLKGREIPVSRRPPCNLVFLLDVSGSMADANKLPLLKQAMQLLVSQLTEDDRVTIVTYAGNAGLRLNATPGDRQDEIKAAIRSLEAAGSTNGEAGIQLAYQKAVENFRPGGSNRVILATDGDVNVGVTDDDGLVTLIQEKARSGVFLSVLGLGTGNYKDAKLEKLADSGNGNFSYLDSLREARKVLGEQMSGTLLTIAKDVKIQVEFNPAEVQAYRLIGYENRLLAEEDFHDDSKDAGDIGSGHTVTALYEIVPVGGRMPARSTGRRLKYQRPAGQPRAPAGRRGELTQAAGSGELLTVQLRYKLPESDTSRLLERTVRDSGQSFNRASGDFQFAAAVAAFGMLLRNSPHKGESNYGLVEELAVAALGSDSEGHRAEFLDLVRKARDLR